MFCYPPSLPERPRWLLLLTSLALLLGGCVALERKGPPISVFEKESFLVDERFSRLFDGSDTATCEAARRSLLSQGYVMSQATPTNLVGTKKFQPTGDVHIEIVFSVVCLTDGKTGKVATAYASAQQERYAVKKSTNSSSIGVSAIGSISIPISSSDDSLVKVASETIASSDFYDRFFSLLAQNLQDLSGGTAAVTKED